jgi:hypothetical protein
MAEKNRINIRFVIYAVLIVFSQAFYFNILIRQGLTAFLFNLAPDVAGPHIHEVYRNLSLLSQEPESTANRSFDTVSTAFSWPNRYVGIFTGAGVGLTTLVFVPIDRFLFIVLFLALYLGMILSPLILLAASARLLTDRKPMVENKKWLAIAIVSLVLLCVLYSLIWLNLDSPRGWRANLFFWASLLVRDAGYYLNAAVYVLFVLLMDFLGIRVIYRLITGGKSSGPKKEEEYRSVIVAGENK